MLCHCYISFNLSFSLEEIKQRRKLTDPRHCTPIFDTEWIREHQILLVPQQRHSRFPAAYHSECLRSQTIQDKEYIVSYLNNSN
jgi:hypothetical protein